MGDPECTQRKEYQDVKLQRIGGFFDHPDPKFQAVLLYGPNRGLLRWRSERLIKALGDALHDRVSILSGEQLAGNPSLLFDRAETLSLFCSERRVIWVKDASDSLTQLFSSFFDRCTTRDLVIVEAGELGGRSQLRVLFETAPQAVAIPCYLEDEHSLATMVKEYLPELSIDHQALSYLVSHLPADRLAAQGELDKLRLFMNQQTTVTLQHVRDCISQARQLDLSDPAWAAASGDHSAVVKSLEQLTSAGYASVTILRTAQRHFQRLHIARVQLGANCSPAQAMAKLKPPVFFKQRSLFVRQLQLWGRTALGEVLDRLLRAEILCKQSGYPDQVICGQVLLEVAGWARKS